MGLVIAGIDQSRAVDLQTIAGANVAPTVTISGVTHSMIVLVPLLSTSTGLPREPGWM